MAHGKDWLEGKIGALQDEIEQQARLNALNATQNAVQQLQLIAQQQAIQLGAERNQALTFLFNQQTQRVVRYGFIQRALTTASNDYMGILLSEGHKPLSISLLASFVGLALVPEFGALAMACGVLKDDWKAVVQLAKAVGKAVDTGKYTSGSDGKDRRGAFAVVNQVVKEVDDRVLADMDAMAAVIQGFTTGIMAGDPAPWRSVQDFWSRAKLQVLQAAGFVAAQSYSDLLSDIILYDMLREYTRRYVVISFESLPFGGGAMITGGFPDTGVMLDSNRLQDIPNQFVKVKGMNDDQREMVYARFSAVAWKDPSRPTVSSWRDLVSRWGAAIPGYQTERRVDARFIGR